MLIEILSAATGAIVGGALTGLASYVRLGKVVAIVETEVRGMVRQCTECRQHLLDHIDDGDRHVNRDMRDRIDRLEHVCNGARK